MRLALFVVGFCAIWGVMYAAGDLQGGGVSFGLLGLAATLSVAVAWELAVMGAVPGRVLVDLGFGRPAVRGVVTAGIVSLAILAYYPAYSLLGAAPLRLLPNWPWLLIGVFAYHGLGEELAWRGYAFRRIREGRSFRSAVLWTMPLIAVTHIPIIAGNGPVIGSVAIVVAAVTCVPLA